MQAGAHLVYLDINAKKRILKVAIGISSLLNEAWFAWRGFSFRTFIRLTQTPVRLTKNNVVTLLELTQEHLIYLYTRKWMTVKSVKLQHVFSEVPPPHSKKKKKKKKVFLKYASWTDILLLFWMSHCLGVHGRGDFEWCWMFYDCLLFYVGSSQSCSETVIGEPHLHCSTAGIWQCGSHTQAGHTATLNIWGASFFKMPCIRSRKMLPGI